MDIQMLEALANGEVDNMELSEMEQIIYDSKLENYQSMCSEDLIEYIIKTHGIEWFDRNGYDRPKFPPEFD
jgi:hypothetical protein